MNHPLNQIISKLLIAALIVTDPDSDGDWPVFVSHMPDGDNTPDNAVAIFDTGGNKVTRILNGASIFGLGNQIMVRATDYATGWAKATAIETYMSSINRTTITIEGTVYLVQVSDQQSPILPLGREPEGKHRDLFTLNFITF